MVGIAAMGMLGWRGALRGKRGGRRLHRHLFLLGLIGISPVLFPLVCLSFPLICVLALCFRFGCDPSGPAHKDDAGSFLRRCEEGAPRLLLLHRYLEDQLGLVGSVVWDCYGDADGDDLREGC